MVTETLAELEVEGLTQVSPRRSGIPFKYGELAPDEGAVVCLACGTELEISEFPFGSLGKYFKEGWRRVTIRWSDGEETLHKYRLDIEGYIGDEIEEEEEYEDEIEEEEIEECESDEESELEDDYYMEVDDAKTVWRKVKGPKRTREHEPTCAIVNGKELPIEPFWFLTGRGKGGRRN